MARGTTLAELVTLLKSELRLATSDALNVNTLPSLKHYIAATQKRLYDEYDWPHLKVRKEKALRAGQRLYDPPDGMGLESIEDVFVFWGNVWGPDALCRGIRPEHYAEMNPIAVSATGNLTITGGTAATASGNFTITNGTADANSTISNVAVNGVNLLTANVTWTGSNAATAQLVAAAINANGTNSTYSASYANATVTITADPDLGNATNGYPVNVTANGNVTVGSVNGLSGGANNRLATLTVNAVNIIESPVGWRTSHQATAAAVAARINETETTPQYTAEANGDTVTISAAASLGSDANEYAVNATVTGNLTVGNLTNMTGGVSAEQCDPPALWDVLDNDGSPQIEFWPVPASNDLRAMFVGKRDLNPLVEDTDAADLDDLTIVFFAAAELLAGKGDQGAELKLRKAQARLARVRARLAGGPKSWGVSPIGPSSGPRRVELRAYTARNQ